MICCFAPPPSCSALFNTGDLGGDADGHAAAGHRPDQPFLAVFDELHHPADVGVVHVDLPPDLRVVVASGLQVGNGPEQLHGLLLAAGDVLHQAHDEAFMLGGLDDEGGNGLLVQGHERLHAPLAANQVVAGRVRAGDGAHRDGLFQPHGGDVVDDLPKLLRVSGPGVQNVDARDGMAMPG